MVKRGQATLFIIIALAIVAILLVMLFYPQVSVKVKDFVAGDFNPNEFLKGCAEKDVRDSMSLISKQGGYAAPEGYAQYGGNKIKYLCYTSTYYKTCVVQQPAIKNHFEKELNELTAPKLKACFDKLKEQYKERGIEVEVSDDEPSVKILPKKIMVLFNNELNIKKGESSERITGLKVELGSEMYDILMIATSIIDFESKYGDSETTLYMQYYPDLEISKKKLSDGTTIYKVSNVITDESFTFASRSLAWPAGYGS